MSILYKAALIEITKKVTKQFLATLEYTDKNYQCYKMLSLIVLLKVVSFLKQFLSKNVINISGKMSASVNIVTAITPSLLFHWLLIALITLTIILKLFLYYHRYTYNRSEIDGSNNIKTPSETIKNSSKSSQSNKRDHDKLLLKWKFLVVFWILRFGDWLQGN